MEDTLYREEILEHYKNPQNFGKPQNFTVSSRQTNPFCGDEIEIFVSWNDEKIRDISFVGTGCAISIAAASLLTDFVKEKIKSRLTKFAEEDMLKLLGIKVSETRKKCAFLALAVLKDCLK